VARAVEQFRPYRRIRQILSKESKIVKADFAAVTLNSNRVDATRVAAVCRMATMNDRFDPAIGRRDLLRILAAGAGATAAASAPLAATADDGRDTARKSRARYQASSPDVQNFYRVNRYPAK